MEAYHKSYLILWTSCAVALEAMERQNYGLAREILRKARQEAEEAAAAQPPDTAAAPGDQPGAVTDN